jgi:glycosyltransferase involved in cell wall biosynthesis
MSEDPLVSAIIPVHDGDRFLHQSIESVLNQSYPRLECIVIDDGSTDESATVARSYGARVRYVHRPQAGVAVARNSGVARSTGALVAFLDADDVWLPHKIETQVRLVKASEGVVFVYSSVCRVDAALTPLSIGWAVPPERIIECAISLDPLTTYLPMTGLVERAAFERAGGFDRRLSTSADTDLACRLTREGSIARLVEPLALYRQHEGQMHRNAEALRHDMEIVIKKMASTSQIPSPERRTVRHARASLDFVLAGSYAEEGRTVAAGLSLGRSLARNPGGAVRTARALVHRLRRTS